MSIKVDSASFAESPARLKRWRHIRFVAVALFREHGYAEVSIDDITRRAAVSRRTFFNYFATKSAVLFDPDPEQSHRLAELLHTEDASAELWPTLSHAVLSYLPAHEVVITARRSILAAEPELEALFVLANPELEHSISDWLAAHEVEPFRVQLVSAIALAVLRAAFRSWQPADGYAAFLELLQHGFELAGRGLGSGLEAAGETTGAHPAP